MLALTSCVRATIRSMSRCLRGASARGLGERRGDAIRIANSVAPDEQHCGRRRNRRLASRGGPGASTCIPPSEVAFREAFRRAGRPPGDQQPELGCSRNVNLYTLTSGNGMTVTITNYGGVVQSIRVPNRERGTTNVALGFSTLSDYVNDFTQGATRPPGRYRGIGRHLLRGDHRPIRKPDRQRLVQPQQHDVSARREQRHEHAPRRVSRLEHSGLDAYRLGGPSCRRAQLDGHSFPQGDGCLMIPQPGLHRLPRDGDRDGHLPRHARQPAEDRIQRSQRLVDLGDRHQPHQPHLLQPGG